MKKLILTALVGASLWLAAAPQSNAAVVVVRHRHRHRHVAVVVAPAPRMVLVPGHWRGPFWHRVWVPAHYVRA